MQKIKKGDIVGRKSYGKDIIFEVIKILKLSSKKKIALLKGVTERIVVDSDISDLEIIDRQEIENKLNCFSKKIDEKIDDNISEKFTQNRLVANYISGKILHLDGDRKYSEKSFKYYQKMGLRAVVKNIPENRQPRMVYNLLSYYKPDILVITGHDGMIRREKGYNDIYNYRNSRHFIETVKEARRYEKDTNSNIVIFAGACQSYFEALIMAGANFASSPGRILIDFFDPLVIAEKIATTDEEKYVTIGDVEKKLRDGRQGVSGIGANREKKK